MNKMKFIRTPYNSIRVFVYGTISKELRTLFNAVCIWGSADKIDESEDMVSWEFSKTLLNYFVERFQRYDTVEFHM